MQTTTGLLDYLRRRPRSTGLTLVLLLAATLAIVAALLLLASIESLAGSVDPIQIAPVRWSHRV